jgi:hypothetical protein
MGETKPIGLDVEEHNEWVQSLIDDVDFEPLKEFLEQLKEQEDSQ